MRYKAVANFRFPLSLHFVSKFQSRVDAINERIESIAAKLYSTKEVLTLEEASLFLGLSKSQLYKLTASAAIPHYKPGGKYIYFDYVDLIEWVRQNPVKSKRQHELDAVRYVTAHPIKKR